MPEFSELEDDVDSRTPPEVFELSLLSDGENRNRIISKFGTPPRVFTTEYWDFSEPDSVKLVWRNWFHGVYLRLRAQGDSLVGSAFTLTDVVDDPRHETSALAVRVDCDSVGLE